MSSGISHRLKNVGADDLSRFTPWALLISATSVLIDVFLQYELQGGSDRTHFVAILALGGIVGSGLWIVWRHAARREDVGFLASRFRFSGTLVPKSFAFSFLLALFLLVPAAHLAIWKSSNDFIEWYRYGFLDKRWLFLLYWILIGALLVFPPVIHRLLSSDPLFSARSSLKRSTPPYSMDLGRAPAVVLRVIIALSLSYLLFGPPWNIERTPLYIDMHEQVHLGPLQAIHKGYLPNIGPASQQYGPGTQLLTYAYMQLADEFNLVGFREAQAMFFLLGFAFYAVLTLVCLGSSWGLIAILLSLSVSPFHLTYWNEFGGFSIWGWPNPLRYLGVLFLTLALAVLLAKRETSRPVDPFTILVGWIWGMFTFASPENLMMGILSGGLLAAFLWATETLSLRRLSVTGLNVALGAAVFWAPFLLFYGFHGYLGEYVSNTFLIGKQVLSGYSNIPTSGSITNVTRNSILFYGSAPFAILVGWSALYEHRELSKPLSWNRALLLALVSVTVTNFFGSMTRTDIYHLLNVSIGLPLLLAYSIKVVPSFVSHRKAMRAATTAALVTFAFSVAFFGYDTGWFVSRVQYPLRKFGTFAQAVEVPASMKSGSFARTGYQTIPQKSSLEAAVTPRDSQSIRRMDDYFELLDRIGARLQGKTTYVHSIPGASPGLAYFLADLTPPPVLLDPYTMVSSSEMEGLFLKHFETIVDKVDCIVSEAQGFPPPEVLLFRRVHDHAVTEQIPFKDDPVYVVCR